MTWDDCLALGATRLSAILGCPVTTAHSWIRRSGPPEWQKMLFLAAIQQAESTPKIEQGADDKRRKRVVRKRS